MLKVYLYSTIAAAIVASGLGAAHFIQVHHLNSRISDLDDQINHPVTGFRDLLATERTNSKQYKAAADTCTASVTAAEVAGKQRDTDAQVTIDKYRAQLAHLKNNPITEYIVVPPMRLPGEDECTAAKRIYAEVNK